MIFRVMVTLIFIVFVASCNKDIKSDVSHDYPVADRDRRDAYAGSLISKDSEAGPGVSIFGGSASKSAAKGLEVNKYLWKAALEIVGGVMPLQQVDAAGGVIITDWYENPKELGYRFKVNVIITEKEMKTSALKIQMFKQQIDREGNWHSVPVEQSLSREIEDKIIYRARQLKIGTSIN